MALKTILVGVVGGVIFGTINAWLGLGPVAAGLLTGGTVGAAVSVVVRKNPGGWLE